MKLALHLYSCKFSALPPPPPSKKQKLTLRFHLIQPGRGHFQVACCSCVKTSPEINEFYLQVYFRAKVIFMSGLALGLVLKQKQKNSIGNGLMACRTKLFFSGYSIGTHLFGDKFEVVH